MTTSERREMIKRRLDEMAREDVDRRREKARLSDELWDIDHPAPMTERTERDDGKGEKSDGK